MTHATLLAEISDGFKGLDDVIMYEELQDMIDSADHIGDVKVNKKERLLIMNNTNLF